MTPKEAYIKARSSGYTRELEILACNDPEWAYYFARNIPEANIEYCQEKACKDDPLYAYYFARDISGADLNYCLEACKGTIYYAEVQVLIMNEAIG